MQFLRMNPRILGFSLSGFLIIFLTISFWEYTQDDVFITYVYSRNIATGHGFVFNIGEHVQGTTTPLYTLLMSGVYFITDDLLHAGNLLSAIFLVITIMLGMEILNHRLSHYGQLAFALTVASSPLVYISFGMETLLYCAVLIGAFFFWARQRLSHAMLLAGVLTWIRSDGIILASVIGVLAMWQNLIKTNLHNWRVIPWRLGILYIVVIAPWYLFATFYFGTPLPQTFSAKEEILQGLGFIFGKQGGLHWWDSLYFENNPLAIIAFPAIIVGSLIMFRDERWRIVPLWSIIYIIGYTTLNVSTYWYFTPLFIALVMQATVSAEWIMKQAVSYGLKRNYALVGSLALVCIFTLHSTIKAHRDLSHRVERVDLYIAAGKWIDANTPDDSLLLVRDLGIAGYYAERETVDTPGLITPDIDFVHNDRYAVAQFKPDIILAVEFGFPPLYGQTWFNSLYQSQVQFDEPLEPFAPMIVFERREMEILDSINSPAKVVQGVPFGISYPFEVYVGTPIPKLAKATIYDSSGDIVLEVEAPFLGNNYPREKAVKSQTLVDTLVVENGLAPGNYTWEIHGGVYKGEFEVISVMEADNFRSLDDQYQWSDFVNLRGVYAPAQIQAWPGGEAEIGLVWEALRQTDEDYSVFVQLQNRDGDIVSQTDGYPRDNTIYTRFWSDNEIIHDIRRIDLPSDLASGEYTIHIGWYNWQTNERFYTQDGLDELILPTRLVIQTPAES